MLESGLKALLWNTVRKPRVDMVKIARIVTPCFRYNNSFRSRLIQFSGSGW